MDFEFFDLLCCCSETFEISWISKNAIIKSINSYNWSSRTVIVRRKVKAILGIFFEDFFKFFHLFG